MIVDIYTHIFPERFFQELERGSPKLGNMGKRLRSVRKLFDLDLRFKDMDAIGDDYRQIISLPNPPIEDIAEGAVANNLAKVANDSMAELVAKYPKRFPAFAAAVNMNDVDFSIAEAERAIKMGAKGVQTFTNITGHPLDEPRFRPFFAAMAAHDLPVWIHPARTSAMSDYASEPRSRFEMWWCFGWPYETTACMTRLIYSGIFDELPTLKIISHHMGGMIPYFAGKIKLGFKQIFFGAPDHNPEALQAGLRKPPLDYFKMLYADTALGEVGPTRCGHDFFGTAHSLFATDAPFDSEVGRGLIRNTIAAVNALEIPQSEKDAIFSGNAKKLLKL